MILRELLAKFGVAYDDTGAKKADRDVGGLKESAKELIGLVGGAAMVGGFARFIVGQAEMASAIGDTAKRIGVGVEALQELRYAASGAGLGAEQLDGALARMGRGAADAARGQGAAKDAFAQLGVQLTDSTGNLRPLDDIVAQVSDGLARVGNESERARLGMDIFGREGSKLTETLKGGSVELELMRAEARALGGVLSDEEVEAAGKADKAIRQFKFGLQGFKNEIAQRFVPTLTKVVDWLRDWTKAARDLAAQTHIVEAVLITAGAAFAAFIGAARLLAIGKAAIAFAIVALAIETIIKTAEGGDTSLSRFIDMLAGKGATLVWIDNWKAGFEILVEDAKELAKQVGIVWEKMKQVSAQRDREAAEKKYKSDLHEYEVQKTQREWRERMMKEHPTMTGLLGFKLGPEPKAPPKPGEPAALTPFQELRTRSRTTERSAVIAGPGRGMLRSEVVGESAEDRAIAARANSERIDAKKREAKEREAAKMKEAANPPAAKVRKRRAPAAEVSLPRDAMQIAPRGAPPVVIHQNNSVNVSATGVDPQAMMRETDKRFRDLTNKGHRQALRSGRQVTG